MKKRKLSVIVAVAVLVVLTAVSVAVLANRNPIDKQNGDSNNEVISEYTAIDSAFARIVLDENGSTGYTWHYILDTEGIVDVTKDQYVEDEYEGLVGYAGKHLWELQPAGKGTVTITMDYYRIWEGIDSSVETRVYSVTVDDGGKISITKVSETKNDPGTETESAR